MAFLKTLAFWVMEWIMTKIVVLFTKARERMNRDERIKREAEKSVEPLKKAKTSDEIDKASDDALGGF